MEDVSCRFILLCSIVYIFTSTYSANPIATHVSTISTTKPPRIVTKLIHFRSVLSPSYVSNYTTDNYTSWIEERSNTRLAYLKARTGILSSNAHAEAELIGGRYGAIFLADISIGNPPVSQYVVMDTASSLLWVHCSSCIGCDDIDEDSVIFDPYESSTYRMLSCSSTYCLPYPEGGCNWDDDTCEFKISYVGAPSATGNLSSETLTFTTSVVETTIPNIVFGCSLGNIKERESNGILGLGADKISLVSQLGSSKFSYCIGDVMDTEYMHNKLVLGRAAVIQGDSTPFEVHFSNYYLKLERISLGEKRVNIDPITFQRNSEEGGVIIDSGTAYTYLLRSAYVALEGEVRRLIDAANLQHFRHPERPQRLCYRGSLFQDLHGFPTLTFHFSGGADLVLENRSMFESVYEGRAFCLAIFISESSDLDVNLIGIMAQQNFNIGYDLSAKTISFEMIDCELLYPDD